MPYRWYLCAIIIFGRGLTAVTVKASQHELWVLAVAGSNPSHFVGMKLESIIMAYSGLAQCCFPRKISRVKVRSHMGCDVMRLKTASR